MKRLNIILTATGLAIALALAPAAESAPGDGAAPKDLKAAIAQAMRSNPDLRLAEAKLAEALAERDRVRLQVTRELVRCYREIELTQAKTALHEELAAPTPPRGAPSSAPR